VKVRDSPAGIALAGFFLYDGCVRIDSKTFGASRMWWPTVRILDVSAKAEPSTQRFGRHAHGK